MHLNEHKVTTLSDAVLMADEFVLYHQSSVHLNELSRSKLSVSVKNKKMVARQSVVSTSADNASFTHTNGEMVCFYCRKTGHKIPDCAVLKKKEKAVKPVGLNFYINGLDGECYLWVISHCWECFCDVVIGVCAMLPIPGVTFILGNDLAGGPNLFKLN